MNKIKRRRVVLMIGFVSVVNRKMQMRVYYAFAVNGMSVSK
ncbi:MAG: hypothetical protein PHO94_00700 [Petrimonas sp.]|nr:hypothetical protein [Petrimonas sp.]